MDKMWTHNMCYSGIFILFCGSQLISGSVNLAFKKPALLSSNYIFPGTTDVYYTAERAVDENTSNIFGTPLDPAGTCCHSRVTNAPSLVYWEVDLGQQSIITSISISYRSNQVVRMNGFSIKISNESLAPGLLCYQDITPGLPAAIQQRNCTVKGRYARYENNIGFAEICNFEAYGCPVNYFGPTCEVPCPVNCLQSLCNPDDGNCLNGCIPGRKGPQCQQECDDGFFGAGCLQQCFCQRSPCNKITGLCPSGGCQAGWVGAHCNQTCSSKRFGLGCSAVCNCDGSDCNPINGTCLNGKCLPGYTLDSCSQRCYQNTFGLDCNGTCGSCSGRVTCNHVTGLCDNGCADGWLGTYCNISCDPGQFGFNCSRECGNCLNGTVCNNMNGDCPNFRCNPGFYGRACSALRRDDNSKNTSSLSTTVVFVLIGLAIAAVMVFIVIKRKKILKRSSDFKYTRSFKYLKPDRNRNGEKPTFLQSSETLDSNTSSKVTTIKEESLSHSNLAFHADEAIYSNDQADEINTNTAIQLQDLANVIENKREKTFCEEFEKLPVGAQFPHEVGQNPNNKTKNRFLATYPYDKNRVILPHIKGVDHSNYINASYIDGLDTEKAYIASQGPKKSTVMDFWRMVWRLKIDKIVMVTNLVEGAKVKCEKYWPDVNDQLTTGPLTIENKKETKYAAFIIRKLKLSSKKSENEMIVYHYHFTRWPDHGTPDPSQLVHFDSRLALHKSTESGPLLVHCSAGIGRTGTFIGLHELTKHGRKANYIDVFQFAKLLRNGRMNMIQTLEQYVCLHEALLEALDNLKTTYLREQFSEVKQELFNENKPKNHTALMKQFEVLKSIQPVYDKRFYSDALDERNKQKNRNTEIIADNRYRTFLTSHPSNDTDYINAVTVPSYTSLTGLITTQMPLPDTVDNFWSMIYDHDSTCIVLLDIIPDTIDLLPPENEFMQLSSLVVYNERVFPRNKTLTDVDILLSPSNEEKDKDRNIKMFISTVEETSIFPNNTELFVCLCESVIEQMKKKENCPVVIVCRDGATRCGMFVTMVTSVQRVIMDKDLDIFDVVKLIQERQPKFVDTYDQYKYVHDLVDDFLESNQLYVNV